MKELITLSLLTFAFVAQAQTTNITVTVIVKDGTGTNSYTLPASAQYIVGANVSWKSYKAASTNNTLAFAPYVRQNVIDRLATWAELGNNFLVKSNKLEDIGNQLPTVFPTMTAADQAALVALWRKYVP